MQRTRRLHVQQRPEQEDIPISKADILSDTGDRGSGVYCSMLSYVHRDRTDCLGQGVQDGHFDFHTVPELCTTRVRVQCCLTSTETLQTTRDGEPRTATSTFTQLLNCSRGTQLAEQ